MSDSLPDRDADRSSDEETGEHDVVTHLVDRDPVDEVARPESSSDEAVADDPRGNDELDPDAAGLEDFHDDGELELDDEVAPPVIGCVRCGARVAMGSRYCPKCGVPLVRSGEYAAASLSRTRRNAPFFVRVTVPLIVLAVAGLIVWQTVLHDPSRDYRGDLRAGFARVLDANRNLSAELERLTVRTVDVSAAAAAAGRAVSTVEAEARELDGMSVPTADTARHAAVTEAIARDLEYVRTVEAILRDTSSSELSRLGSRSARTVAALREVREVPDAAEAIAGTRKLGQWVRAQRAGAGRASSGPARGASFVTEADKIVEAGRPVQADAMRAFELVRAARDGVGSFKAERGVAPADAKAALAEAATLFTSIAQRRRALVTQAEGLAARQENERQLAVKLVAFQTAAAASADTLRECLAGANAAPQKLAATCLTGVRDRSQAESAARTSFRVGITPARKAVGLSGLDNRF